MDSIDKDPDQITSPSSSPSNVISADPWKERILIPTLLAGIVGGGVGLISKHRKVLGLYRTAAAYSSNFAIVTGCYCGAREFMRVSRTGKPDDLLNSVIGGIGSGAILGRLQATQHNLTSLYHDGLGGQTGAVRYSVIFAAVGTAVDYAILKVKPTIIELTEKKEGWFKLPEWSPIQVLDNEAVAAKRTREQQIYRNVHNLSKEES